MAVSSSVKRGALVPSAEIVGCARWHFASVGDAGAEAGGIADPAALQEARQDGWNEGFAAGREHALAEAQIQMDSYLATQGREAAERLAALLSAAESALADSQEVLARGTLEIACALARQVLRHELATNPNALEPVVREALTILLSDGKTACVRLSLADFDMLDAPLRTEFSGQTITVVGDAAIAPGDCLIESGGAVVDGGVANRWSRAVASLGLALPWQEADEKAA